MNKDQLKALWTKEEENGFKGWDFSHLDTRWDSETLPWDYRLILKSYLNPSDRLLDMGTGGGEFLLSLGHPYDKTSVTEAFEPNVLVCQEKLSPLGILVKQVEDDAFLPFDDDSFDIIINKHEAYEANEIRRILKTNGLFITQQVGGRNNEILSKRLSQNFEPLYPNVFLKHYVNMLENENFEILYQNEYFPSLHFYDVGALVYFAKIIEWEFPNFTVDRCFNELLKMHEELEDKPFIESLEHRFIIVARNKKE